MKEDRPQRADAQRNRAVLLDAAATVFARAGLEAPVQEIVDEAKLGPGTLYRHFPTRGALVEAVMEKQMTRYAEAAETAAKRAETEPWAAFSTYVLQVFQQQADDSAFAQALIAPITGSLAFRQQHLRALRASIRLAHLAADAGVLNPSFHHSDFYLMQIANGAIASATREDAPDAWRRFAQYALSALRNNDSDLPPVTSDWADMTTRIATRGTRDPG